MTDAIPVPRWRPRCVRHDVHTREMSRKIRKRINRRRGGTSVTGNGDLGFDPDNSRQVLGCDFRHLGVNQCRPIGGAVA